MLKNGRRSGRLHMSHHVQDSIFLTILLIVGCVLVLVAMDIPLNQAHDPLGPRFFPLVAGGLVAGGAVGALLNRVLSVLGPRARSDASVTTEPQNSSSADANLEENRNLDATIVASPWSEAGIAIGLVAAYLLLLPALGFLVATPPAMWFFFRNIGGSTRWHGFALALVTTLGLYTLCTIVLGIRLP